MLRSDTVRLRDEDLFPIDFYSKLVETVYSKQLAAAGVSTLSLQGSDMLCKRVERALDNHGIKFNKGSVAKLLRHRLSQMKSFADLPPDTQTHARALIAAINAAFERI